MLAKIQHALMLLARRADQQEQAILDTAFVNVGNLLANLSSIDHQIIFGRRGTGKTHILRYFRNEKIKLGDLAIYIDMRNIGSETSIYSNAEINITDRAKRLLLDVFNTIVNEILETSFDIGSATDNIFNKIDTLQSQLSSIKVTASRTIEERTGQVVASNSGFALDLNKGTPSLGYSTADEINRSSDRKSTYTENEEIKVTFSGISPAFNEVADSLSSRRIWILLDEWVAIPPDLQPILSDLIRRTLLTCHKISVKIGAIEVGSKFIEKHGDGSYLGFELGADVQADISLDDFMVFGNDGSKAEQFFAELFRKHVMAIDPSLKFTTDEDFVAYCFTQKNSFSELVRASEGVPRDAINIFRLAASKFSGEKYSIQMIRNAARIWYERDKSSSISDNEKILLQWIIDNVIKGKKARGFLLAQEQFRKRNDISSLTNNRVLHIVKRGISSKDNPGARYDVYSIDYGCYVELLTTSIAPLPLSVSGDFIDEVPHDDYRSLRRAILDLNEFDNYMCASKSK